MGAEVQIHTVTAEHRSELKAKYVELVEQAKYDHGHSGYSGTIAESPGLTILKGSMTENEAEDYFYTKAVKWEKSSAIKIKGKKNTYFVGGCYSA